MCFSNVSAHIEAWVGDARERHSYKLTRAVESQDDRRGRIVTGAIWMTEENAIKFAASLRTGAFKGMVALEQTCCEEKKFIPLS